MREFILPELNCQPHGDYLTSSILELAYLLGSEQTHKHHQLYSFTFTGSPKLTGPLIFVV